MVLRALKPVCTVSIQQSMLPMNHGNRTPSTLCGYIVVPRHRANSRRRRNAPAFMLLMKGMVTDILLLPAVLAEKYPEKNEGFPREGWAMHVQCALQEKVCLNKDTGLGLPRATTVCASNMGQKLLISLFSAKLPLTLYGNYSSFFNPQFQSDRTHLNLCTTWLDT